MGDKLDMHIVSNGLSIFNGDCGYKCALITKTPSVYPHFLVFPSNVICISNLFGIFLVIFIKT